MLNGSVRGIYNEITDGLAITSDLVRISGSSSMNDVPWPISVFVCI